MDVAQTVSNNKLQPINAGSLNPFHKSNYNIQKFTVNLNHKSQPSKKRARPKGIPKYRESESKKRKKNNKNSDQSAPIVNENDETTLHVKSLNQYSQNTKQVAMPNIGMKLNLSDIVHAMDSENRNKRKKGYNICVELKGDIKKKKKEKTEIKKCVSSKSKLKSKETELIQGYLTRSKRRQLEKHRLDDGYKTLPIIPYKDKKKKSKKHNKKRAKKRLKKCKTKTLLNSLNILSNMNEASQTIHTMAREKGMQLWMSIPNEIDNKFNNSTRLLKNCISNYVIHKKHVNIHWLQQGQGQDIQIKNTKTNYSYYTHWYSDDMNMYGSSDYIRLHCINLNKQYINLECPHCRIYLQCISLSDNCNSNCKIGFMCFNYPRCKYPLNDEDYQSKYIWDNVKYVGPLICINNNDEDINLLSFGNNKHEYMQWIRAQDRLNKKLSERINWKQLLRKTRHKQLNKQYNKLRKLKSFNIKNNKEFIVHVFKNRKDKINQLRQQNMIKFKKMVDNQQTQQTNDYIHYKIKSVMPAVKVVLTVFSGSLQTKIYRTRSQTNNRTRSQTILYKDESDNDNDNDNDTLDPPYIPSPIPLHIAYDYEQEIINDNKIKKQKRRKQFEITNIDRLIFIDLYKASKPNSNNKWLFDQLRNSCKRYDNLKFQTFNKCMKQLLKPNAEKQLVENLALESMPVLPAHELPFDDTLTTKKKGKQLLNLKQLPVFDLDLNAFANKFKLTF